MKQRLDYKRTLLLGFGFLGVSVMWLVTRGEAKNWAGSDDRLG